jgi:PAS domain S-box-containing protein
MNVLSSRPSFAFQDRAPSSERRASGSLRSASVDGLDLVRDAMLVLRTDGVVLDLNEAAVRLYGYSRGELIGMSIDRLRPVSLHASIAAHLAAANAGGVEFDTRHVTKDGRTLHVEVSAQGCDVACGRVIVGTIRDVTAHRSALEELRRSEANFRTVLDNCPDPIALAIGGELSYVNSAWLALLGYNEASSCIGRSVFDVIHPDEHQDVRARIADLETVQPRVERRLVRSDGTIATVLVTTTTLSFHDGPALLVHARDLTGQKILESQLVIAERLTSVGTLAAGVAHEINNPLAYVTNNLEFARSEAQALAAMIDDEGPIAVRLREMTQALREAELGAERVRQIVLDLKTFSRIDDESRGSVDVRKTLELAISMATNEIRHRARLVFQAAPVPKIDANEAKLGQVFLNILINAAQAIPEGRADSHVIRVGLGTDSQRQVVITISDDGEGIAPELLQRVFDPFFTTKPQGIGTGLGLAICHNIVRSLKGEIAIESTLGLGTTVRITLPAVMSTLQHTPSNRTSLMPRPSRARIVLVDDEPMIGAAVARILGRDHDVVLLSKAREAVDRITAGERFDVILCDLMMPQMTGMDLFAVLTEIAPDQAERMRFVTGGTFTEGARTFVDQRPHRVIAKPFRSSQLRKLIAEMFET